jgi:hypothetical protein
MAAFGCEADIGLTTLNFRLLSISDMGGAEPFLAPECPGQRHGT